MSYTMQKKRLIIIFGDIFTFHYLFKSQNKMANECSKIRAARAAVCRKITSPVLPAGKENKYVKKQLSWYVLLKIAGRRDDFEIEAGQK